VREAINLDPTPAAEVKAPSDVQSSAEIFVRAHATDAVHSFVAQMTQKGPTNQIGRWKDDICPIFSGLGDAQTSMIEQRMAADWQTVGFSPPPRHCEASLIIVFTNDAAFVAADFAKRFR
jgi:hypothetical protein